MTALYLTGLVGLQLGLTLLVMAAGTLSALALGVTHRLILLMIGLAGFGVLGMLTFWVYLASAHAGRAFAIDAMLACPIVCVLAAIRIRRAGTARLLRPLLPPVAFFATTTWFMTAIGYQRGGLHAADMTSRNRFVASLPNDNTLPYLLAKQLQDPSRPLPHFLAKPWQTSDRPPMQTGVYLLEQGVLGHVNFLHFQVVSMLAQSCWVFGVWAFMVAARMSRRAVALALAVTAFSGFAFVNTFFVWPKLFPAAYLMLAAAAVLGGSFETFRRSRGAGLALGVTIGCAMLGHPGSMFVVLALAITIFAVRAWPSWRLLLAAGVGAAVMYVPWMLFQKYYAPPGNFLTKYQLTPIRSYFNTQSLSSALRSSYEKAGWTTSLWNKWQNLLTPLHDWWGIWPKVWHSVTEHPLQLSGTSDTNYNVEHSIFFYFVPAMGLMAWGMVALLVRIVLARWRPSPGTEPQSWQLRIGLLSLVCLVVNWVIWAIALFGPRATVNHQGSYFLQLLGLCLGVIGWWLVSPRLCAVLVTVQCVYEVWIYGYGPPYKVGGARPINAHNSTQLVLLSLLALAGALASLWWLSRDDGEAGFEAGFEQPVRRAGRHDRSDVESVAPPSPAPVT